MSVALYTFDKPRDDARQAGWLAQHPTAAVHVFPAKLRPSAPEARDPLPRWKMIGGFVIGIWIAGCWFAAATGYQGGFFG